MTELEQLVRQVSAGKTIKPWLLLGPFYEDLSAQVQGLTLFERPGATVGQPTMLEVVDGAQELLAATPREGDEARFRGQLERWSLLRRPEPYLAWGNYYIANHLAAAFLATVVTPHAAGSRRWRLVTRISSRAIVAVDGAVVFDTALNPVEPANGSFSYQFEAALQPGEHVVTVGMFRIGRMAQVGCRLEVVDGDIQVRVPLGSGLSLQARAQVEAELAGISLGRDLFYPEDPVALTLGIAPGQGTTLRVRLLATSGRVLHEITPTAAGTVQLCRGDELADGAYQIDCAWHDQHAEPLTSVAYQIQKTTPAPRVTGYEQLEERKRRVLEHYSVPQASRDDPQEPAFSHIMIWPEVARYAQGRFGDVDERIIGETCAFIAARKDCADFAIQGILRLLCWERRDPHLSAAITAQMKDTVLGFKYWVDEPGDTVMYMGSENHRLLFHVAEWLAGQLFPTDEFTNSRQRGLYHALKGRMFITEWLRQRGRFGFDEWHSNAYYPICIAPLLNVYDFTIYEDQKLRQMAGAVLDYMFFNLAADSFDGTFGTTHGRSYGRYIKYPDYDGTAMICWLLYGTGSLASHLSGMAPVTLASSAYRLPSLLARIATDTTSVVESRQRQGILPGHARHANFIVYRTPDYMLSAVQDHRKGEYEPSTHVAQITLGNKVAIFWSCPQTSGEGSGLRPDYWSGHTTLPRAIQHRNVLSLTWRLSEYAWMTHCFFEQERFDAVRLEDNWAFAQVGNGYVGMYSQHGMVVGDTGQYAGRELICDAAENTWLVECGRAADWGSFDAFVSAIQAATIEVRDGVIVYESPSIGRFVTGWDVAPSAGGEPIAVQGYPLVESSWAQSAFGSGTLTIRYGNEEYELWFNQ